MVFNVTNSLTNSTKTEPNQDSLIRYLEEEHNRASNLNYTADIHISSIDKKNQVIAEIDCKLPFPSKSEIATFVTDFVNGGEIQKGKTRKISLPFRKSDETAPTETPTPTEPTPVAPAVTPKVEATPTEPTPVAPTTETAPTEAPKKTGTYQAPASQPKNTNISKAYKGISAVVLGLTAVSYTHLDVYKRQVVNKGYNVGRSTAKTLKKGARFTKQTTVCLLYTSESLKQRMLLF